MPRKFRRPARDLRGLELHKHRKRLAPVPLRLPRNELRKGADWLYPKTALGYRASVERLLDVPWGSIKHWLAGRRPMPAWARDKLLEAVRARLEIGRLIEAELAAYEPPVKVRRPVRRKTAEAFPQYRCRRARLNLFDQ